MLLRDGGTPGLLRGRDCIQRLRRVNGLLRRVQKSVSFAVDLLHDGYCPVDLFLGDLLGSAPQHALIGGIAAEDAVIFESTEHLAGAAAGDGGDEFVEIVFWLDGETAEAEVDAIINTLAK